MSCKYAARLRNARRIGWVLKKYLKEGFLILDENRYAITSVNFKGFHGNMGLSIDDWIYMDSDPDYSDGMELTIKQFNNQFKDWICVKPENFKKIV